MLLFSSTAALAQKQAADDTNHLLLRELWVPSTALAPVLERYPRAVPLSRDQLLTLVRDARAADPSAPDPALAPPERAVLRQGRFEGRLVPGAASSSDNPMVRVEASLEVEVLSDAWADVPLGLPGVSLGTLEILDPSAGPASLPRPGNLRLQGRGPHRLKLGFLLPVKSTAEGNSITLPVVNGPAEFTLHLPAGTHANSEHGCAVAPEPNGGAGIIARVALPVTTSASSSTVTLQWRNPPPASAEAAAVILQENWLDATVEESRVAIRQRVWVRSELGALPAEARLTLPAGARAVRVEGATTTWGLGADGLRVTPAPDATYGGGRGTFTVVYDLPLALDPSGAPARVAVPLLEVVGAHFVKGNAMVSRGRGAQVRRVEPSPIAAPATGKAFEQDTPGFVAIFALNDLPAAPAAPNENPAPPLALTVEARRATARFSVDADARADFQPDGARFQRTLTFHVEEDAVFAARVRLPHGETLLGLRAGDAKSATPEWRVEDGGDLLLTWNDGLAEGSNTALVLETRAELGAPKTGVPAEFSFDAATVPGAERLTGYATLTSAPELRVTATAGEERLERRDGRATPVRGDVAWFYRDGFHLALRVERRAAETEARFTGYALPLAGAVEIHAQLDYHFLYAGVESVKIRVPTDLAEAFFFTGEHIAERRREGGVWTIQFQGAQSGQYTLGVRATIPSPADRNDPQRFHFQLPAVVPLECARWSGAWAVEANTDTEIRFALAGANEVDTLHAPALAGYQPRRRVIGVFEFLGGALDPAIDLDGVRHPAAGVAAAVVDRLELETFASTSGVSRHRATIRARVAGDGFFNLRLPAGAQLWSLTLDGGLVKPVGGAAGELRVELPGGRTAANASAIVAVYETPGKPWGENGERSLAAPGFDPGVPVLQNRWKLRLPDGFEYRLDGPEPTAYLRLGELLVPRLARSLAHGVYNVISAPFPVFNSVQIRGRRRAAPIVNDARIPDNGASEAMELTDKWQRPVRRFGLEADPKRGVTRVLHDDQGTVAITRKLNAIIFPKVDFQQTTIGDAVEYLRRESRLLDVAEPNPENRGVNIFLKLPTAVPPVPSSTAQAIPGLPATVPNLDPAGSRITLSLTRIPLLAALGQVAQQAGLKVKIEPYAVSIVPLSEGTEQMLTKEFRVPPTFTTTTSGGGTTDTTGTGSGPLISRRDAKTFLESLGVTFPVGASAAYLPSAKKIVVRDTRENIDLLENLLRQNVHANSTKSNELSFEQDRLMYGPPPNAIAGGFDARDGLRVAGLLPIRLDLPANGKVYEFAGGGAPAALDFGFTDWRVVARERWTWLALGALGFLILAAAWLRPWRRTFYAALALSFFPLIIAPSATVTCNALLAGWLWALAGWCLTRFLLGRRHPLKRTVITLLCASALLPSRARAEAASAPETVIVPYDATKPADTQKPAQYYLPYERFLTLWDAAKRHRQPPVPLSPDGEAYTLSAARYDARLTNGTLEIDAALDLLTSRPGWTAVPLQFAGTQLGAIMLDGTPATLDAEGRLLVGAPGSHRANVTLRLPATTVAAGTRLAWNVPPTTATLVTFLLPRADLRAELGDGTPPGGGAVEEVTPEGRRLTASLGGATKVELVFRDAPPPAPVAGQPALARILARLTAGLRRETVNAEFHLEFPGGAQDHFTILLDRSLTLAELAAPDAKQWRLVTGGDRQTLELTLNSPARDDYRLTLAADRPAPGADAAGPRVFPLVSAVAARVEQTASLLPDGAVEITLPQGPPDGARRVTDDPPDHARVFAAFAGDGTTPISYNARAAVEKREARINYLYQVGHGKIELAASVRLVAPPGGAPLLTADLDLPAGFEIQAVAGGAVRQWWREGNTLSLRFQPAAAAQSEIPLLVYLVRQFDRAPDRLALQPLTAVGFTETDGQTVVAADRSHKVGLALPTGAEGRDLGEIDAASAAPEFQVKAPLQRQRAFRYRGAKFDVAATLENLPARWEAQWVARATVREGVVAVEIRVNARVTQGALEALEFTLPPGLAEARFGGPDVRETLSPAPVNGGERRAYRVLFQNPVYAGEESGFTVSLELPLGADGRASVPDLAFADGAGVGGRAAGGFLLVENASSGEMALEPKGLDPAVEKDVPFLPPEIVAGTRFFRAAPNAPWSLGVRVTDLEKTAGRAALVAYAELTTSLLANGEEWHRAAYRLQNRRLQFLPVELPPGMEFIGARVAGESVRVDAGQPPLLLVPLLKTRPGELSYDVELTYRRPARPLAKGGRAGREPLFANWRMEDPRLPGVPVEKTLWDVWLPNDARLIQSGGNLEPVIAALSETEKLKSSLSDLRNLSAVYGSEKATRQERRRALTNYQALADQVTRAASQDFSGRLGKDADVGGLLKRANKRSQATAVLDDARSILGEVEQLNSANNIVAQQARQLPGSNTYTGSTNLSAGTLSLNGMIAPSLSQSSSAGVFVGGRTSSQSVAGLSGEKNRDEFAMLQAPQRNEIWRDNREDGKKKASIDDALSPSETPAPEQMPNRSQLALNDSVSVDLPAEKTAAKPKDYKLAMSVPGTSLEPPAGPEGQKSLSTARALNEKPARVDGDDKAAFSFSANAPAAAPAVATPRPEEAEAPRAESLRAAGRISLAVDFPREGQVYHFKKIKDEARLTLWSARPARFARLGWLGFLLAGIAAWWTIHQKVHHRGHREHRGEKKKTGRGSE